MAFVPWMVLGALGLNWQASKDLENVGSGGGRPGGGGFNGFWPGTFLGLAIGLWVGISCGGTLQRWYGNVEGFLTWFLDDDAKKKDEQRRLTN